MNIKNISQERKKMIIQASKDMDKRMAAAANQKIKQQISQKEFDENYIIELFTITEDQAFEIQELQATIAKQQTLIDNLTEKLKVIGEVIQTDVEEKVTIKKVKAKKEVVKKVKAKALATA